jgi:hypothetical protein
MRAVRITERDVRPVYATKRVMDNDAEHYNIVNGVFAKNGWAYVLGVDDALKEELEGKGGFIDFDFDLYPIYKKKKPVHDKFENQLYFIRKTETPTDDLLVITSLTRTDIIDVKYTYSDNVEKIGMGYVDVAKDIRLEIPAFITRDVQGKAKIIVTTKYADDTTSVVTHIL